MPDSQSQNDNNIGGFPSNNKSAGEAQKPNPANETGNQNEGVGIDRKTERNDRPEQA